MKMRVCTFAAFAAMLLVSAGLVRAQQQSADEKAVWKLEHDYWEYVKALDIEKYLSLWHPDFVGWPFSSAQPQRKDHITDWMKQYTEKGMRLKSYTLEPAASHATGNLVVTYYLLTYHWTDAQGQGEPQIFRVTHTWLRTPEGWKIIGGMSARIASPAGK